MAYAGFWAMASVAAISLVGADKQGRAMGVVVSGLSVATIIGVPGGTLLAQHAGWEAAFWAVAAMTALSTIALLNVLPGGRDTTTSQPRLATELRSLMQPGRRTVIDDSPDAITAFLRPRPVRQLPGVGAKAAATLAEYGLHTVGDVADVPQLTLQRLLGARAGRTLHERAQGRDTAIVDPTPTPASISTEHRFARDEPDLAQHRRALLAVADDLGARLRGSGQVVTGLTCTVRYADSSSTRRSRTLPEATLHTVLLARAAYAVYESLGLQRARVRSIALRADALRPADRATRQLTWKITPAPAPTWAKHPHTRTGAATRPWPHGRTGR
ncbi:MFS transporter [Streptomyces mirabilis]|uniref:MFS transporter n=1 Tax=Streptomyces mirabilis TaxID=68239 RepID=UPI0036E585B2